MPTETIVGSSLSQFLAGGVTVGLEEIRGPGGLGATLEFELLDADGVAVPVLVGASPLEVDGLPLTCLTFTDLTSQKAQDARSLDSAGAGGTDVRPGERPGRPHPAGDARRADRICRTGRCSWIASTRSCFAPSARVSCTAVLFVDLDGFKQVNDTRARRRRHDAADGGRQLVAVLRPMDTVARIGGDEFVVLAPDVDSDLHVADMSARLISALSRGTEQGRPAMCSVRAWASPSRRADGGPRSRCSTRPTSRCTRPRRSAAGAPRSSTGARAEIQQRTAAHRRLQTALDGRRVRSPVSAHRRPGGGNHRRLRGAGPRRQARGLGAAARGVHPRRRGQRPRRAARHPGSRDGLPRGGNLAGDRTPDSPTTVAVNLSARQVEAGNLPALSSGPSRAGRPGPEVPASRAHRDRAHRSAPGPRRAARAHQGSRRGDRPRRLRDRLRLAHPPAPSPPHVREDRPGLREGPGDRHGRRAHRRCRCGPGRESRPALHRRRRGDTRATRPPAGARLRPGPGLFFSRPLSPGDVPAAIQQQGVW